MFGIKTKKDRQIEEMQAQLANLAHVLRDKEAQDEENEENAPGFDEIVEIDVDAADLPQAYITAKWNNEHEAFKLDINWNAPFLRNAIGMGVDGETDLEVAAFGFMVFAQQIIEQDRERRATKKNAVPDFREE